MESDLIFANMMTLDSMTLANKISKQEACQIYSKLYSQWYELTQIPNKEN